MPIKDIPINVGLNLAVDEVGLKTHNAAMHDCFVDELGGVNRRPGLVEFCDLGTSSPVDGIFWWGYYSYLIAVSGGLAFKVTASDGSIFSQLTGSVFTPGNRVIFGDWDSSWFAADGGNIVKGDTTSVGEISDVDAPANISHIAVLDRYLLAGQTNSRRVWYPQVNDPDDWQAEYFSKDAQFDKLQATRVAGLEAYLIGERSMEVWHNDGSTPFVRLGQGFVQSGTVAPYSFVYCDAVSSFVWLDHERKVVMLNGRTPAVLSATMTKYIQSFSYVTDALGDYMVLAGRPYYKIDFPTEDKTLIWDFIKEQWYEWGYWNSGSASYERWRGNCYCLAPAWNFSLVGDKSNGKIYKVDPTVFTDDGDTIRMLNRTGHVDWDAPGTKKKSVALNLRLKRTQVATPPGPVQMVIQYRDNGATTWKTEKTITISTTAADTEYRASIRQLGAYYSRQWQFIYTDPNVGCSLVQAQEEFEYL